MSTHGHLVLQVFLFAIMPRLDHKNCLYVASTLVTHLSPCLVCTSCVSPERSGGNQCGFSLHTTRPLCCALLAVTAKLFADYRTFWTGVTQECFGRAVVDGGRKRDGFEFFLCVCVLFHFPPPGFMVGWSPVSNYSVRITTRPHLINSAKETVCAGDILSSHWSL